MTNKQGEVAFPLSVDVVVPCYNVANYVARALASIENNQGVGVRIIAIDDGSTDDTLRILNRVGQRVTIESGPNKGACVARNRGLALATSPWVMFIDADDFLEPGTLKGLIAALESDGADLAIAPVIVADVEGTRLKCRRPRHETTAKFISDWMLGRFVPPCGILWRTEALRSIGGWNEALKKNQDGDVVLRAVLAGFRVAVSDEGAAIYWDHDGADRISNTISDLKLRDSFDVLCSTHQAISELNSGNSETEQAFSHASHALERLAARNGLSLIQSDIRHYRNRAGWPTLEGNWMHRAVSWAVGLTQKEKLSLFLHNVLNRRNRSK